METLYFNVRSGIKTNILFLGSGCDSVGRAVASKTEIHGSYPVNEKFYFLSAMFVLFEFALEL